MIRRLATVTVLLVAAGRAPAYEVVLRSGQTHQVSSMAAIQEAYVLETEQGPLTVPESELDFYTTFKRNVAAGQGNVAVFKTGRYLAFQELEFKDGWAVITVSDGSVASVTENLLDFERSVIEAGMQRLSTGGGAGLSVAKAVEGGRGTAERAEDYGSNRGASRRSSRSAAARRQQLRERAKARSATQTSKSSGN